MKQAQSPMSPLSWAFLTGFGLLMYFILFQPTLKEFLVFLAADHVSLFLMHWIDRRLFVWTFPDAFLYFDPAAFELARQIALEQRTSLFESMVRFPRRRALYTSLVSFLKQVPAALVIILYWHHATPLWQHVSIVLLCFSIANAYLYAAVFIESHELMSRKIAEFHKAHDWSEVFRRAAPTLARQETDFHEAAALVAIWLFMLLLQWQLVGSGAWESHEKGILMVLVGIGGLTLMTRIWYLERRFFVRGLRKVFASLESFDPESSPEILPLHSASELSYFEKVYNSLHEKLRSYQQELSRWVFYQTEESRYRALGELSALIVHDLSAPLHVIQFCTEQLQEAPELIRNPRYLDQLAVNGQRSLELINSLKAYLKDGSYRPTGVKLEEAHREVLRLVETQFEPKWIASVSWQIDTRLENLAFNIPKADLIHVLMNLYRNSLENLSQNAIPEPRLSLEPLELTSDTATILIADNGTGLSAKRFEELTAFHFSPASLNRDRKGLGLRLVRRLVERNSGTLTAMDPKPGEAGARICLKLLMVGNPREDIGHEERETHLDHRG